MNIVFMSKATHPHASVTEKILNHPVFKAENKTSVWKPHGTQLLCIQRHSQEFRLHE